MAIGGVQQPPVMDDENLDTVSHLMHGPVFVEIGRVVEIGPETMAEHVFTLLELGNGTRQKNTVVCSTRSLRFATKFQDSFPIALTEKGSSTKPGEGFTTPL